MISAIKLAHTRNPQPGKPSRYANFDLEDLDGTMRCIMWPNTFEQSGNLVVAESVVLIRGSIDKKPDSDEANLIVNEIIPYAQAASRFTSGVQIQLDEEKHGVEVISRLREILRGYPGERTLSYTVRMSSGEVVHLKNGKHRVDIDPELRARIDGLLGPGSHRIISAKPDLKSGQSRGKKFPSKQN